MRACIAAIILVVCSPGGLARAQSGTDVSPAIPVHPDVSTILQLPERIERSWMHYGDDFRVKGVGSKVYVRPYPGTPAGTEALLEVKTRTLHRIFLLRVVARAGDARREVVVHAAPAAVGVEEAARDATAVTPTPAEPAASAPCPAPDEPAVPPAAEEPAASAPTSAASPAPAEPEPTDAPAAERATEADMDSDTATAGRSRFDLFAHAIVGLGVTALDFAGHDPRTGFQPHHALGIRLAGEPPGGWWALEVELSVESLAGPLTYYNAPAPDLEVSGPRLRGMLGMRVQGGIRWMPSVYAGIGAHAHLRETKGSSWLGGAPSSEMKHGGVMALGMGLQYRTRGISLGFDVQVRSGALDEYRSIEAFLTVGRVLDQGE